MFSPRAQNLIHSYFHSCNMPLTTRQRQDAQLFRHLKNEHNQDEEAATRDFLLIEDLLKIQEFALFMVPKRGKKAYNRSFLQVMEARIEQEL